MDPTRTEILEAEFIRPPQPGLRLLNASIISLGRQLRLNLFLPEADRVQLSAEEAELQDTALTWLLDLRNPDAVVYDVIQLGGRDWLFAQLPVYMRTLSATLMALARTEMKITGRAVGAAMYDIQPKPTEPGAKPPPSPPPNS